MKKIIALLLAVAMVAVMAAGCAPAGNKETTAATTTAPQIVVPASALEILETVWASYGDNEKFFCMGGDMNNMVDGAPGKYDVKDEGMTYTLLVPADQVANVDDAASMVHAMNLNTFTCGVFHMAAGADATAFAAAMQAAVQGNQWMCGFPEKLIIAVVGGEYVLCAFGVNDTMNPFETKLTAAYPEAVLAYNEAITG